MYNWLEYVQNIVKLYPERAEVYTSLDPDAKKEVDAVAAACRLLDLETDGAMRLQAIQARYWTEPGCTIEHIAEVLFSSRSTVKRWDRRFTKTVAVLLGVYDPVSGPALPPS